MQGRETTWLVGPIETLEDAEAVISDGVNGFYAVAAIIFLAMAYLFVLHNTLVGNPFEPIFLALNGWLLLRNKSRVIASVIFLYSLVILAITIAEKIGLQLYDGMNGTYVILAVFFTYVAYRCTRGTFVYHRRLGTKINWKETILRSVLSPTYAVAALLINIAALYFTGVAENLMERPDGFWLELNNLITFSLPLIVFYATALGKIPPTGRAAPVMAELSKSGSDTEAV